MAQIMPKNLGLTKGQALHKRGQRVGEGLTPNSGDNMRGLITEVREGLNIRRDIPVLDSHSTPPKGHISKVSEKKTRNQERKK